MANFEETQGFFSKQQTSTTMWTTPSTPEEENYYSKHAPKRKVYSVITTVLQLAHIALAYFAWAGIFTWGLGNMSLHPIIIPLLALGVLIALHTLFRTNWSIFWYDRLDDDPNTDSSPWIAIIILGLLLFTEQQGARLYLEAQVKPAEIVTTTNADSIHQINLSALTATFERDKQNIYDLANQKIRASTLTLENKIKTLKRRRAKSDAERRHINNQIIALEAQRIKILEGIEQERSANLQGALLAYNSQKANAATVHSAEANRIVSGNTDEAQRYKAEMANVSKYSWIISIALLSIIAALIYAMVRINVKSGILPRRTYTILDAHGSPFDRIYTAISDALNRRWLQLATAIHRSLSPKGALTSFDGTVVAMPGKYNTPSGQVPAKSHPTLSDEEIKAKVAKKVMEAAAKGKITITPELLEEEYKKARDMNGTYSRDTLGKA